ncbi:hypothetical protein G6F56_013566 [Rhizopus delemar]|nr:hypothetical protein G6F56_013566 [Rhizopus delemar]
MIGQTTSPNNQSLKTIKSQSSLPKSRNSKIYSAQEQKPNETRLKGVLDKFVGGFGQGDRPTTTMDISSPYNTRHVTHVGFDASTGEFTGLPKEWHTLLKSSGITQTEQEQNPQKIL